RLGCISQVTASSFTGRFGKRAQQFSADLLHREWIHIVATDGHSAQQRPPHFNGAAAFITKHKNAELAQALCSTNPWAVMRDAELSYSPELPAKKKSLWARLRS